MNKRQRIDQFLARQPYTDGIPAAFFQHFEPTQRHGTAAVEAQLDFYRATDMDMMKIMFDDIYPKFAVKNPEDWRHVPDFSPNDPVFTQQIEVADRLVNAVGKEDVYKRQGEGGLSPLFYSAVGFVRRGEMRTKIVSFARISANRMRRQQVRLSMLMRDVYKRQVLLLTLFISSFPMYPDSSIHILQHKADKSGLPYIRQFFVSCIGS